MDVVSRVFGSLLLAHTEQTRMKPEDVSAETDFRGWLGDMVEIHDNTFFIKGSQYWNWKDETVNHREHLVATTFQPRLNAT